MSGFSSLLDIGKLIRVWLDVEDKKRFSSLLDIGKLIPLRSRYSLPRSFSSLLDIGKLIHIGIITLVLLVLAHCWI